MTLVGMCAQFCPKREVDERTRNRQLDPLFEREVVFKRYTRSAAGRSAEKPEDVRPPAVLLKTVEYLLGDTVRLADFPRCYPFIWDRLWAVRQDLTLQQSACVLTRKILVRCVKFYTVSVVLCSGRDVPLSSFDPKINDTHLVDTLGKLLRIYEELEIEDEDRPLMESLWLLINLRSSRIVYRAFNLSPEIKSKMKHVLKLAKTYFSSNNFRFLHSIDELHVLESCLVSKILNSVRLDLLQILNVAFSSRSCAFPLAVLSDWLNCDESDCEKIVEFCGLPLDGNSRVNFLKTHRNCRFIEDQTTLFPNDSRKFAISEDLSSILLL
ncbi:SAC3 domain-containing protein 1 [Galendromus occidentalis]|uniref:SAC3 domain-containing protein 1 n=1 Tax=Galendromus occidentalis TaxID=34638 RepID=A0AAJ6VZQ7_9ACAR|nr:SAC3 domain-containing protein 1 [Galendromus occidentalis]